MKLYGLNSLIQLFGGCFTEREEDRRTPPTSYVKSLPTHISPLCGNNPCPFPFL